MAHKQSKNSARAIKAKERAVDAVELRKRGLDYADIANELGMSKSGVHKAIAKLMHDYPVEAIESYRAIEDQRIQAVMDALWPKVSAGDVAAAQAFATQQRNRYALMGLPAPPRAAVNEKGETVGDGDGFDAVAVLAGRIARIADKRSAGDGSGEPGAQ